MKVKELIEKLSEFNPELEVCKCEWSEWEVDCIYYRYAGRPHKEKSIRYNKQRESNNQIENKHFVCL